MLFCVAEAASSVFHLFELTTAIKKLLLKGLIVLWEMRQLLIISFWSFFFVFSTTEEKYIQLLKNAQTSVSGSYSNKYFKYQICMKMLI